jgi:hypothetical protein
MPQPFPDVAAPQEGLEIVGPVLQVAGQLVEGLAQLVGVEVVLDEHLEDHQRQVVILLGPAAQAGNRTLVAALHVDQGRLDVDGFGIATALAIALEVLAGLVVGAEAAGGEQADAGVAGAGRQVSVQVPSGLVVVPPGQGFLGLAE